MHAEGRGVFQDPHTVLVHLSAGGTRTISARYILVAVGGRAVKAPIDGSVRDTHACNIPEYSGCCAAPVSVSVSVYVLPCKHLYICACAAV